MGPLPWLPWSFGEAGTGSPHFANEKVKSRGGEAPALARSGGWQVQIPVETLVSASPGVTCLTLLLSLQGLVPTKGQGPKCPAWCLHTPLPSEHQRRPFLGIC